ncbi:hypothetical protein [Aequorivita echinoideorum]|uniref:Uncharacterized protein n=1 Tax=Aequorivita echinoideorum TaxID=1549647 RepID=A0ABS5S5B7_9FLAO|nr:hypothetical protein [Aequorivita echinoideorum]MBT0607557.1 hypothetical protein [Aequorivita echinoideorum]
MKNYLNILHYCFYLFFVKLDYWFNKVNPFLLLYKIPSIKKYHQKQDWNPYHERKKIWNDQKYGFNIIIAGGILIATLAGIFISLVFLINNIFKIYTTIPTYIIVTSCALAYFISYLFEFKEDMYLNYFEKYQFWNVNKKRMNIFLSLLFVVFVMIVIIFCVFKN